MYMITFYVYLVFPIVVLPFFVVWFEKLCSSIVYMHKVLHNVVSIVYGVTLLLSIHYHKYLIWY